MLRLCRKYLFLRRPAKLWFRWIYFHITYQNNHPFLLHEVSFYVLRLNIAPDIIEDQRCRSLAALQLDFSTWVNHLLILRTDLYFASHDSEHAFL